MKCDLCHIEETASHPAKHPETSILCPSCEAVISRLITIEHWMKHRIEDDMRNRLQEKMLLAFLSENPASKAKANGV